MSTLVIALPAVQRDLHTETPWWLVVDGRILDRGSNSEWLSHVTGSRRGRCSLVGLAPAAAVRVSRGAAGGTAATPRQAAAVARVAAIQQSLGDPETLHALAVPTGGQGEFVSAVVANVAMREWLDWADRLGVELDHIVPIGALMPDTDMWVSATIGNQAMVSRHALVLPDEPAITEPILAGADVVPLEPAFADAAIVAVAERPWPDLRGGRFAKRRRLVLDQDRVRELIIICGLIPLITLAWAVASVVRLDQGSDRLDGESLRLTEAVLGRAATIETAEAELRQHAAGRTGLGFAAPASALLQLLQLEAGVSSTQISYREDGTLAVTLAAPSLDEINRVLVALQRDGYRVTAVPRQSPDGRAMVDVTVRSGL